MDILDTILVIAVVLAIFAVVAATFGIDSRESFRDEHLQRDLGWRLR